MARTQREKFIAALLARGYIRQQGRGSKYDEFVPGPQCRSLLKAKEDGSTREHRVLVGKAGALRYTTSRLATSIPFLERMKAKLLEEAS